MINEVGVFEFSNIIQYIFQPGEVDNIFIDFNHHDIKDENGKKLYHCLTAIFPYENTNGFMGGGISAIIIDKNGKVTVNE